MGEPRLSYLRFRREDAARETSIWLDALTQDVRYAVRSLRRQPGFVGAVIFTLALAVGANLTVFSLVDALFFRPPGGVIDASSLRRLYSVRRGPADAITEKPAGERFGYEEFRSIRDATRGVARVAIDFPYDSIDVEHGQSSSAVGVSYTSADLLPMLGVRMERGRTFSEADDDVNSPALVAVVSHAFAERTFGRSADAIGAELRIRDRIYRVIGVSEPEFNGVGISAISVWLPFSSWARPDPGDSRPWYSRGDSFIPLLVRLLPGADPKALTARATLGYQRIHRPGTRAYADERIIAGPLQNARGPGYHSREELIAPRLAAVAIMLFVIACANVANLLLARSWTRRRELAVRIALGVSRGRLAMLVLTDALVLAVFAGILSLLFGHWAGGVLRTQLLPSVHWSDAVLAPRVMLFVVVITLLTALLAGAAPALVVSRGTTTDALKSGSPEGGTRRSHLRSVLIVVQAALAVVLIVGAALFGKSLRNVRGVDLGYDSNRLVVASVYFADRQPHPEAAQQMMQVAERVSHLHGVAGAVATYGGPLDSWISFPLYRVDADSTNPIKNTPSFIGVVPDYFRVVGTRILEGRGFLSSDRRAAEPVMIVGAGMARKLWPHEPAVGQCLRPRAPSNPCYRIIGVAEDAHELRIVTDESETQYYFALDQLPMKTASPRTIIARAGTKSPGEIANALRAMLRETFPSADVRSASMFTVLEPQMRSWILGARIFAALSALALLVAMIGIYAMAAFDARQRTREIGVRIALGARARDVVSLLVQQTSYIVATGVACGAVAAVVAGRFFESVLFGVSSRDPASIVGAATALLIVAMAASFVPSWRASRADPVVVLRSE